jgi:hypothetical protein
MDRAVDLLQLGKEFGGETEITVASQRELFVLTPELLVDRAEPDQLVFLRRGEALMTVALGDEALDRRGKRGSLSRLVACLPFRPDDSGSAHGGRNL